MQPRMIRFFIVCVCVCVCVVNSLKAQQLEIVTTATPTNYDKVSPSGLMEVNTLTTNIDSAISAVIFENFPLDSTLHAFAPVDTHRLLSQPTHWSIHYQQLYKGVPVKGGGITSIISGPNFPCELFGEVVLHRLQPTLYDFSKFTISDTPSISEAAALQATGVSSTDFPITLSIKYFPQEQQAHLVYEVDVFKEDELKRFVVDAHTGTVIEGFRLSDKLNAPTHNYGEVNLNDNFRNGAEHLETTPGTLAGDGQVIIYNISSAIDPSLPQNNQGSCEQPFVEPLYIETNIPETNASSWPGNVGNSADFNRLSMYQALYLGEQTHHAFAEVLGTEFGTVEIGVGCNADGASALGGGDLDNSQLTFGVATLISGSPIASYAVRDILIHEFAHIYIRQFFLSGDSGNLSSGMHEAIADIIAQYLSSIFEDQENDNPIEELHQYIFDGINSSNCYSYAYPIKIVLADGNQVSLLTDDDWDLYPDADDFIYPFDITPDGSDETLSVASPAAVSDLAEACTGNWILAGEIDGFLSDAYRDPSNGSMEPCVGEVIASSDIYEVAEPLSVWHFNAVQGLMAINGDSELENMTVVTELILDALPMMENDQSYNNLATQIVNTAEDLFGPCSAEATLMRRLWHEACITTAFDVDCVASVSGPFQVCSSANSFTLCYENNFSTQQELNEANWTIIGPQSTEFQVNGNNQTGNTISGDRCIEIITQPDYNFYPQYVTFRAYLPGYGTNGIATKKIRIIDCENPPTRPPSRPCFGEADVQAEARSDSGNLYFLHNKGNAPSYYRLYDLYGRQIKQATDVDLLLEDIPVTGIYIRAAFDENGRLIESEKIMLFDR